MSMRGQLLVKLASRGRLITTVASCACLYLLCIMPSFANHASVEEDTIYPGGTAPFVRANDFSKSVMHMLHDDDGTEYSVQLSGRDGGREGLVYAFMGSEGDKIGRALANSLSRVPWLSKDVYFVFPDSAESLKNWLNWFYQEMPGEKPIVRGAFVLDLFARGPHSLQMSVEGANGILPNEDWGNVMFEVAGDLGISLRVRSLYESIVYQALNGGVGEPHTVFLDNAIPALKLHAHNRGGKGASNLQVAQLVGRHLRAVAAIELQLHHSTHWYFYTGPAFHEISMGLFLPLLIGLFSPLIFAVVDLNGHTELPIYSWLIIVYVVAGIVSIGYLSYAAVVDFFGGFDSNFCQAGVIKPPSTSIVFPSLVLIVTILHFGISRWLQRCFDSDPLNKCVYGFSKTLRATVHEMYVVALVGLTILHWSLAFIVTLIVLPMLLLSSSVSRMSPRSALFFLSVVGAVLALVSLISGELYLIPRANVGSILESAVQTLPKSKWFPFELIHFLKDWAYGRISLGKSIEQHAFESVCHTGLALPVLVGTVVPAVVLVAEIAFSRETGCTQKLQPVVTGPPWLNPRRMAAIVVGVSMMVYQTYFSD